MALQHLKDQREVFQNWLLRLWSLRIFSTVNHCLCGSVASDRETIRVTFPSVQICCILSCTKLTLKSIIDLVLYFPFHKDEILNHSWFSNGGPGCGGRSSPQPPKKSHF